MSRFTCFSQHAFERVHERTRLSCEEIAYILDQKLIVNTGRKPGFNRAHLVFYSAADDECFVAIQDETTGTVVTILPLEYQAEWAWPITDTQCAKAREIYLAAPPQAALTKSHMAPSKFVIAVHFLDATASPKTTVVLKVDASQYGFDGKALLHSPTLFAEAIASAELHGIPSGQVTSISVRLGHKGVPVHFDLVEPETMQAKLAWKELGSSSEFNC